MKIFYTKPDFLTLQKEEADVLAKSVKEVYGKNEGYRNLGTSVNNTYKDLSKNFKSKFANEKWLVLYENDKKNIKDSKGDYQTLLPDYTFLKNLFYTRNLPNNKDYGSINAHFYNIDLCYVFAYGKTREEYRTDMRQQTIEAINSGGTMTNFKIVISSIHTYGSEVEKIKAYIEANLGYVVEVDYRDVQVFKKVAMPSLINSVNNGSVFHIIGKSYLHDESCIVELNEVRKSIPQEFIRKSVVFLLKDIYEGDYDIKISTGKHKINEQWEQRIQFLENKVIKEAGNNLKIIPEEKKKEINDAIDARDKMKGIISEMGHVIDFIHKEANSIPFEHFINYTKPEDFSTILSCSLPSTQMTNAKNEIENSLEYLFNTIKINNSKDPKNPEFPPKPFYKPKFPASAVRRIKIDGFKNVFIKDESTNPTGSHKDRMALEVVVQYKAFIESLKYRQTSELPELSIISSGSAALSIQHMLNLYKIPTKLRVLHDSKLDKDILKNLSASGCLLFPCELKEKLLTAEDIKSKTENDKGIDITYREALDPNNDNYYDWMSYEIINQNADYYLIPFGTGDLFINVLKITKREHLNSLVNRNDKRYKGSIDILRKANFIGATTHFEKSKLTKLYSYFLPSEEAYRKYIIGCKELNCCGSFTGINDVDEDLVEEAMKIAEKNGISCEYSGIAGLALLLQLKSQIPTDKKVLIINTGKTKSFEEIRLHALKYYVG